VRAAIDQLYGGDPDEFMAQRSALAAAAKKAGDAPVGRRITALRKPTRSAYTVNALSRTDPDAVAELADLGSQLRDAERSVDAQQIRELTTRRRRLVDQLTRRAFEVTGERSPSSALRDEVVSTLTAALADDDVAAQVIEGTLVKPARWEGFGFGGAPDLTVVSGGRTPTASRPGAKHVARKGMSAADREEARQRAAAAEAEQRQQAKAAAEAAKRAALDDARRSAEEADEAVILAADEEQVRVERLRVVEEQVAAARRGVDEARIQLRRAEIRQRRTRDALDKLSR